LNDPSNTQRIQELSEPSYAKAMPITGLSTDSKLVSGPTEPVSLSKLMSLSESVNAVKEELDAFKMVHISFGLGPGPRTGFMNADGRISLDDFRRVTNLFLCSSY